MFSSEEVRGKISAIPISHENVIEYSLQRINSEGNQIIDLLKNRVDRGSKLDHLERWYGPSIDLVPGKYRREVKEKILRFMEEMTEAEEEEIRDWSMTEFIQTENAKNKTAKLKRIWD